MNPYGPTTADTQRDLREAAQAIREAEDTLRQLRSVIRSAIL